MKDKMYWGVYVLLSAAYLALTFSLPTAGSTLTRYHLTQSQAHLIALSVAIPLIMIWFMAFLGFINLKEYSTLIRKDPDGRAIKRLAYGFSILVIGTPFYYLLTSTTNYWNRNGAHLASTTIITNYAGIALYLGAFGVIGWGAASLLKSARVRSNFIENRLFMSGYGVLAGVYTYLAMTNPVRRIPSASVPKAAYYLPDWLIATTIVLPYVLTWLLGLYTAHAIYLYRRTSAGIIYRRAFGLVALGITEVVVTSVVLQILTSYTASLNNLSLKPLLGVVYLLLIIIAIGYILIALGAKRLKKIEGV